MLYEHFLIIIKVERNFFSLSFISYTHKIHSTHGNEKHTRLFPSLYRLLFHVHRFGKVNKGSIPEKGSPLNTQERKKNTFLLNCTFRNSFEMRLLKTNTFGKQTDIIFKFYGIAIIWNRPMVGNRKKLNTHLP